MVRKAKYFRADNVIVGDITVGGEVDRVDYVEDRFGEHVDLTVAGKRFSFTLGAQIPVFGNVDPYEDRKFDRS